MSSTDHKQAQAAGSRSDSPGSTTPAGIPRSLTPFFQEYDIEQLDPGQHPDLIIERVLAYGNRVEVRWLLEQYGRSQIIAWIRRFGARRLPWRRYNLWCVLFDLQPADQTRPKERQI